MSVFLKSSSREVALTCRLLIDRRQGVRQIREARPCCFAAGVLPVALGSEDSAAANWLQAQFAGRMVRKDPWVHRTLSCHGPHSPVPGFQGIDTSLE